MRRKFIHSFIHSYSQSCIYSILIIFLQAGRKEVTERDPEEMSIYDLTHHPSVSVKFSIGHIVTRASKDSKDSKSKKHKRDKKDKDKGKKHKSSKKIKVPKDKENVSGGSAAIGGASSTAPDADVDDAPEAGDAEHALTDGQAENAADGEIQRMDDVSLAAEILVGAIGGQETGDCENAADGATDSANDSVNDSFVDGVADVVVDGATGGEAASSSCPKSGKNLGMVTSFDPEVNSS